MRATTEAGPPVIRDGAVPGPPAPDPAVPGSHVPDPLRPDRSLPDLRLAGFAVGVWLSALAALLAGAVAGVVTAAIAGLVTGAVIFGHRVGRRHRPRARPRPRPGMRGLGGGRGRWIVSAVLLGVVCGSLVTAARVTVRDSGPLARLTAAGATVTVDAVLRDDPRALRGSPGRPPTWLVAVDLVEVGTPEPGRIRLSARALILGAAPAWRGLLPGQRITVEGRLLTPRGGDLNAAVLSTTAVPERHGGPSWAQTAAGALRAGLQRACAGLPAEPGGLLPGLVVGDVSRLDPMVEQDFRTTGMTHLTAVSGANIALLLGLVLFVMRWTRAGPLVTAVVCAVALAGFVLLVRPSPSVVRAAAMGAVGLLALASGRPRAAVPALSAAAAVLVLLDPELAGDAGFTLSVLATGGLLLLAPRWRDRLRRRGVPAGVAEALAVPAAAQLACAPVVAGLSGAVSLVAVPANLVAVPAIAPATFLGVGAAVLSPVWPGGAEFLAWLASWPARWLVAVSRYGAQVPAGAVPWPDGLTGALLLGGITVALLVAARRPVVRRLVAVITVAAVLGSVPVRMVASGWPPPGWLAVACAVGQGDAVVLPTGEGRAMVVDAGPEPSPVDRCLRRLGIREVTVFVVSHFHLDHVGGISGVFRARDVRLVVTPQVTAGGPGRDLVAATARGVPVRAVLPGWRYMSGPLDVQVLGTDTPLAGTRSDANNNSLVLHARVGGRTVLLAGDAEVEQQQALLARYGASGVRADVLKVAHHGSAYQDPAFLDAVRPAVALVCVGADNDYGHPNAALLGRLTRGGARVLRTDTGGDVAATAVDGRLAVAERGPDG